MRIYFDVTELQDDGKRHLVRHDGKGEIAYDELLKHAHCVSGDLGWCDIPDADPASGAEGHRVMTCVYCGKEYPQDTPGWDNGVLTAHIKICPKHPLRKAEADLALVRKALAGLIGEETKKNLERMLELIQGGYCIQQVSSVPIKETKVAAINALLATMPEVSDEH